MNRNSVLCLWPVFALIVLLCPGASRGQGPEKTVKLSFDGTTLVEVVKAMSAHTGKNFVVEQGLRERRLTVISARPVTRDEAYRAFLSALEIEGIEAVEDGAFVRVQRKNSLPEASYRRPVENPIPDDAIRQVDDTHWAISRKKMEPVGGDVSSLMMHARIVPHMKDGKATGFKLYAIRPRSLYARLGFMNGDVVAKINDQEIGSPERALELYQKLRDAKTFTVDIIRRGEPRKHIYQIE